MEEALGRKLGQSSNGEAEAAKRAFSPRTPACRVAGAAAARWLLEAGPHDDGQQEVVLALLGAGM